MAKRKREVNGLKGKKKYVEGTPRELKRLETSINYDDRRKVEGLMGDEEKKSIR